MSLRAEHLCVRYGRIEAVRGVSIEVSAGQVAAVIGANGAGKSTTLMALSGILPVSGGRIVFDGEDLTGKRADEIVARGIVQVPEGRRVFRGLTVIENLQMGGFLRRREGTLSVEIERVFSLFPILAERRHQRAGTLSGGEQQMLAIGRALMARPRILLLDEPSLGLAPKMVMRIFEALASIRAQGTGVLLVEQNARLALQMADRAYVMENGRIVLEGAGRQLLENDLVRAAYLGG